MTDAQIKHMVERFLGWRLPEDFSPDAGITFKAAFNEHTAYPMRHAPVGTNLFDAQQAEAMVRYLVQGMPAAQGDAGVDAPRTAPETWPNCHDESDCGNVTVCRAVEGAYAAPAAVCIEYEPHGNGYRETAESWARRSAALAAQGDAEPVALSPGQPGTRYQHNTRGGEYTLRLIGQAQCDKPINDYDQLVAYVDDKTGMCWFRPPHELFDDNRFTRIADTAPRPTSDDARPVIEGWLSDDPAIGSPSFASDYETIAWWRKNGIVYRRVSLQEIAPQLKTESGVDTHPDDAAVDAFAAAMRVKLAKKRGEGRSGWQDCDPSTLSTMLREHVDKGDPIDVANFCMMLFGLGARVTAAPTSDDARDAGRYRWLRDPNTDVALVLDKVAGSTPSIEGLESAAYRTYEYRSGDDLDTAIDAAIARQAAATEGDHG